MAEDIISTLPDPILCHILSYMQTKNAITTSILSKRWNNIWRSVPVLDFSDITIKYQNSYVGFINFVYSVFLSRDPAFPINTFHLDVTYPYDLDLILDPHGPVNTFTKWVNFVVQRRVEYLYLSVVSSGLEYSKLPFSSTVVVLKLNRFIVQEGFSLVSLPSLKTLHLEDSSFPKLRDLMLLLTGCPILEDLFTFNVVFDSDESITCDEWKIFCLSNLTYADIDCYRFHFPLKAVHNVPSLCLEIDQGYCRNDSIPTFYNLTHLEFSCASLHHSWKFLIQVLNHCPKLQKLDLDEIRPDEVEVLWTKNKDKENWVDPKFVPQCLSSHLRTCNFLSFSGLRGQIMLARYILKNAEVLQTMTIWNTGQSKIKGQLSSSPKASASCKLIVYHVPYNREN